MLRRGLVLVAVVLFGAAFVTACGREDTTAKDPEQVLAKTFAGENRIESGQLDAGVNLALDARDLGYSQGFTVSGPFEDREEAGLPSFDLTVTGEGEGEGAQNFSLGAIATQDAGYIAFQDQAFEIDPAVFERLDTASFLSELHPARWIVDPANEGSEGIDGVDTIHVSGTADTKLMFAELERAAEELGLGAGGFSASEDLVDQATIDVFSGADDGLVRRLDLGVTWHSELEGGEPFEATLDFSLTLADVNEDQEIQAPEAPRPLSEGVDQLPSELSGLGRSLASDSASAIGVPPDDLTAARSFDDYTLYYLGPSFHGLPLTFTGRGSGTGLDRDWSFIYGDCTPSGNEGGCAPPLEIQSASICTRFPALYPGPTPTTSPMNGAETLPAWGGFEVYTGHTAVVIFGGDKSDVIRSLTRVNDDVTPATLPAPASGSLEGKLPCQAQILERFSP